MSSKNINLNFLSISEQNYKAQIIECLNKIKGGGNFVTHQTTDFVFPGLHVNNVGEISYPISTKQGQALIKAAHKAPFGKGHDTILDDTVRNTWEIDADQLSLHGKGWDKFLKTIINKIKPELGLEGYSISAHLYKMLIYEKGGFFLPHKDSEKEKGMFGTLIIGLHSKHTGGAMVIRFDGEERVISFEEDTNDFLIPYTAFYADCEHEIKPVTSGYRVCLVYNLVKEDTKKDIKLEPRENMVSLLADLLKDKSDTETLIPHIILLGHQYTPENFSIKSLKLNDRAKADVLFRAADKAGYYAQLCLVTSYLSGSPASDVGYYDEDDDTEMGEVYDEQLSIEHWGKEGVPALSEIKFKEKDLIVSFTLNEGEPIVKESTGYMGNYGPDVMYWYHYGAVAIWSKETQSILLSQENDITKLQWIDYYAKNADKITEEEIKAADEILCSHLGYSQDYRQANYNAIVNWVIARNNKTLFLTLDQDKLQLYFTKIDVDHWVKLFNFFPVETTSKILKKIAEIPSLPVITQLLAILRALSTDAKFNQLITAQMKVLPDYLSKSTSASKKEKWPVNNTALKEILFLENIFPQNEEWVNNMAAELTTNRERKYINNIVAAEALASNGKIKLAYRLLLMCQEDLQQRVNNQPQPPADWSREMPLVSEHKKQWAELKSFLASPVERVFDYRKNQNERTEMEYAIKKVTIDLKIETIRKGSPHTLRITKTTAAYQKSMQEWNEDVSLLKKVNGKI